MRGFLRGRNRENVASQEEAAKQCLHVERSGSVTAGQERCNWNRGVIPPFTATGLLDVKHMLIGGGDTVEYKEEGNAS